MSAAVRNTECWHADARDKMQQYQQLYDAVPVEKQELKLRGYQQELVEKCIAENCMIVLPTGSGKTRVAVAVVQHFMQKATAEPRQDNPLYLLKRPIALFIVDRIPLVFQQAHVFDIHTEYKVGRYCGDTGWYVWSSELNDKQVVVMTAGLCLNVLKEKKFRLADVCVLVLDEAHHTTGQHPFNMLMREYYFTLEPEHRPHVMAMTASPLQTSGNNSLQKTVENVQTLCTNLHCNVALPTQPEHERELEQFVHQPPLQIIEFREQQSQYTMVNTLLADFLNNLIGVLVKHFQLAADAIKPLQPDLSNLEQFQRDCQLQLLELERHPGARQFESFHCTWLWVLDKMDEIIEGVETVEDIGQEAFKMLKELLLKYEREWGDEIQSIVDRCSLESKPQGTTHMSDLNIALSSLMRSSKLYETVKTGNMKELELLSSSKVTTLMSFLKVITGLQSQSDQQLSVSSIPASNAGTNGVTGTSATNNHLHFDTDNGKMMIFARTRTSAKLIADMIMKDSQLKDVLTPVVLLGHGNTSNKLQADDSLSREKGMNAAQQREQLKQFKMGAKNVLVTTSIGEEGVDVPTCNYVIRFDPADTITALIQSRGRARHKDSTFVAILQAQSSDHKKLNALRLNELLMMEAVTGIATGTLEVRSKLEKLTDGGAREFLLKDAKQVLYQYVQQKYNKDPTVAPKYKTSENIGSQIAPNFRSVCELPIGCGVNSAVAEGRNKATAESVAAYNALVELHQMHLLDGLQGLNYRELYDRRSEQAKREFQSQRKETAAVVYELREDTLRQLEELRPDSASSGTSSATSFSTSPTQPSSISSDSSQSYKFFSQHSNGSEVSSAASDVSCTSSTDGDLLFAPASDAEEELVKQGNYKGRLLEMAARYNWPEGLCFEDQPSVQHVNNTQWWPCILRIRTDRNSPPIKITGKMLNKKATHQLVSLRAIQLLKERGLVN